MCQRTHHTLLYFKTHIKPTPKFHDQGTSQEDTSVGPHAVIRLKSDILLMTCRVLITAPDSSTVEARALLDNASSASFISKRLVYSLSLPRMHQSIHVRNRWSVPQDTHTIICSSSTLISATLWKENQCHCCCAPKGHL